MARTWRGLGADDLVAPSNGRRTARDETRRDLRTRRAPRSALLRDEAAHEAEAERDAREAARDDVGGHQADEARQAAVDEARGEIALQREGEVPEDGREDRDGRRREIDGIRARRECASRGARDEPAFAPPL